MKRDAKQVFTELLVLKAQNGDEKAFSDLYGLWAKDVFRLSSFLLRDHQVAEEVSQEAWISVAKGLRRLNDPARFCPWVFRIVRRRCIDSIRKRQAERKHREVLESELPADAVESAAKSEASDALFESIQKLDTDSRLLIHLFYETGLTVAEVADALELPVGTVKSRLFAIREKLKRDIERIVI